MWISIPCLGFNQLLFFNFLLVCVSCTRRCHCGISTHAHAVLRSFILTASIALSFPHLSSLYFLVGFIMLFSYTDTMCFGISFCNQPCYCMCGEHNSLWFQKLTYSFVWLANLCWAPVPCPVHYWGGTGNTAKEKYKILVLGEFAF
jgi:hypothetical protein